jgi:hypothetical protein
LVHAMLNATLDYFSEIISIMLSASECQ